jgi:hypothetical protein
MGGRTLLRSQAKPKPTEAEIAYLAGIIDGEGSICAVINNDKKQPSLRVIVEMTDENVIKWIRERFEGQYCLHPRRNPNRKPMYQVKWVGRYAKNLLRVVTPYLIGKRKQAELALKWPVFPRHDWCKLPSWAEEKRETIRQELCKLNRKGIPEPTAAPSQA